MCKYRNMKSVVEEEKFFSTLQSSSGSFNNQIGLD